MVCTRCGANNSNEALFCQKCGKRLEVINERPTLPAPPYEYSPYTNYGSPEPTYPPPPPTVISENIVKPFTQTHTYNRKIYLTIITALVIMLIGAGILAGIILGRGGFQTNAGNTQSITGVTPTLARVLPTPTHTLSTFTEAPLSDGRLQAWQSAPHAHWIQTRWIENGQWTAWVSSPYPSSGAGVSGLFSYIQQDITYFEVWLDDGSCWQYHKLSTWSNDNWTPFYPC